MGQCGGCNWVGGYVEREVVSILEDNKEWACSYVERVMLIIKVVWG